MVISNNFTTVLKHLKFFKVFIVSGKLLYNLIAIFITLF
jgi:hypothetical protein